jgi:long-subunit fatty acid transport protein
LNTAFSFGIAANYWFGGENGSKTYEQVAKLTSITTKPVRDTLYTNSANLTVKEKSDIRVTGINLDFGILINLNKNIKFGCVYKTGPKLNFENEFVSYTNKKIDSTASYSESADLNFPYTWGLGLSYKPFKKWTLSTDLTVSNWSAARLTQISISPLKGSPSLLVQEPYPGNGAEISGSPRGQHNTSQLRFGMEYLLFGRDFKIPLRAGIFSNTQYITDGHNDRISYLGLTGGAGMVFTYFMIDLAYVYQKGSSFYHVNALGDREFNAHQLYLSLIYRPNFSIHK